MISSILPTPPDDADIYHVYQLTYAQKSNQNVHDNFVWRDMHDGPMPLDYNIWILRNAHRTILVDTGFGARAAADRGRHLTHDPIEALTRIGVDPETLEHVVITHLHYDHAGNMDRFPAARFHVQESEVMFATGRCMCDPFMRLPFDVEDVVTLVRHTFAERVEFHHGPAHPFPGISLHHLPGHAQGLQSVRVATPRGPVVLASDASHYYANFLNRAAMVLTLDLPRTLESYRQLQTLANGPESIIPGHDPKVRDYFPKLSINGVPLTVLHEAPEPHSREEFAAYVYPADAPG